MHVNVVVSSILDSVDQNVWEIFVNNPFLISIARTVSSIGALPVLLPLSFAVGAYLWMKTSSVLLGVTPWIALQVNSLVVANLKDWTDVARPPREFWLGGASAGSFPSGHVSNTTAFVVVVFLLLSQVHPSRQRTLASAGIALCVSMAWSRLALNVHWLSDVIAGWFVGAMTSFVVLRLVQRIKSQRESQLQTHGSPGD